MYARSTTVLADPRSIDDGVTYLREKVLPTLEGTAGCIGLSMLTDRESGRCIAATAWETDEAMRATTQQVRPIRNQLVQRLGGEDAEVREWEIGVVHRRRPAGDGASAQVTWARIQPNLVPDLLDAYRINLMP